MKMNCLWKSVLLVVVCCFVVARSQTLQYVDPPTLLWKGTTSQSGNGVVEGNGVYMAPDDSMLVSVAFDSTITAFNPNNGTVIWTYSPPTIGFELRSVSGVHFSNKGFRPFLVFAVVDAYDTDQAKTRIIGLDMSGKDLFSSNPLSGVAAGTPVADRTGSHVFVTHNVNKTIGYFSILETANAVSGTPIDPIYSSTYRDTSANASSVTRPFSPIGYYHNPAEGHYEGGQGNRNDIFVFAWNTAANDSTIGSGDGRSFVFQFPVNYPTNTNISFALLSDNPTDWHTITPPTITNQGLSMYWAITKGNEDCYVGVAAGSARTYWNRGRTARLQGFARGQRPYPPYQAARAPPTVSGDVAQPMVFGVGPHKQIWSANYDYSNSTIISVPDIVSSKILVSPDDKFIYYATQVNLNATGGGYLYQANTTSIGTTTWSLMITGGIQGDMAMKSDGSVLYAANPTGDVFAYRVAVNTAPTAAPVVAVPTQSPTAVQVVPTATPSIVSSDSPSLVPSIAVTESTTLAPNAGEGLSDFPSMLPSLAATLASVEAEKTPPPTRTSIQTAAPSVSPPKPVAMPVTAPVSVPVAPPVARPSPRPLSAARLVQGMAPTRIFVIVTFIAFLI